MSERSALYEEEAKVFKALAHPDRLRLIEALGEGRLCVRELVDATGVGFSSVSKHLSQLKEAGALTEERRGQQVFYSVKLPCVAKSVECAKSIVLKNLKLRAAELGAELASFACRDEGRTKKKGSGK